MNLHQREYSLKQWYSEMLRIRAKGDPKARQSVKEVAQYTLRFAELCDWQHGQTPCLLSAGKDKNCAVNVINIQPFSQCMDSRICLSFWYLNIKLTDLELVAILSGAMNEN